MVRDLLTLTILMARISVSIVAFIWIGFCLFGRPLKV
jgi:hypothetical protein